MFKGVFTKNYIALVGVLMVTSESLKTGISDNRSKVDKTAKVYKDFRAISEKEAEIDIGVEGAVEKTKQKVPTPPQLLTETQAEVISSYIISKLLTKPNVINVPQVVNQPEVSTGVESFMVSSQTKYDWRLKLNKTVHAISKYGPSGIMVIPRQDGIDMETISPGNGHYDMCKKEGMCVLNKNYSFLMDMIDLNTNSLTGLGKKILEKPEVIHHLLQGSHDMGYYKIESHVSGENCSMSGFTPQEQSKAMLKHLPVPMTSGQAAAYKGQTIKFDECCYEDDGKFGEVDAADKLALMEACFPITFHTVHLDDRLANLKEIPSVNQQSGQGTSNRMKYMVMSVNGFPIWVKPVTSEMIIVSDLFLSSDNEKAKTLVEALEATEKYNTEYHRSVLFGLRDIINQENVIFDPKVFQRNDMGRLEIKDFQTLSGEKVRLNEHVFEVKSAAADIAAITGALPAPTTYADDVTGNNPLMSSQHVAGNRTQVEGQRLTQNSESRFFVYAGFFYMSVVNPFARTCIEHIVARPSWVEVMDLQNDRMTPATISQLVEYSKQYYQEQTGLIPNSSGDPAIAQAIMNMLAGNPQLSQEYDQGDIMAYFAKSGGWSDFPKIRRPHARTQPIGINNSGAGALDPGKSALAAQLAQGNQPQQQEQPLTDESAAQIEAQQVAQQQAAAGQQPQ